MSETAATCDTCGQTPAIPGKSRPGNIPGFYCVTHRSQIEDFVTPERPGVADPTKVSEASSREFFSVGNFHMRTIEEGIKFIEAMPAISIQEQRSRTCLVGWLRRQAEAQQTIYSLEIAMANHRTAMGR